MSICVNTSNPDFIRLSNEVGFLEAYKSMLSNSEIINDFTIKHNIDNYSSAVDGKLNDSDKKHIYNVLAFKMFSFEFNNNIDSDKTIKQAIIDDFIAESQEDYNDNKITKQQLINVISISDKLFKNENNLWSNFLKYVSSEFNIEINEDSDVNDLEIINKDWNTSLSSKGTNTASQLFKKMIAVCSKQGTYNTSLTGMPDMYSVRDIWGKLMNIHSNDITKEQYANSLLEIITKTNKYKINEDVVSKDGDFIKDDSRRTFIKSIAQHSGLSDFIDKLIKEDGTIINEDLFNSYMSAMRNNVIKMIMVLKSTDGYIDTIHHNRKANNQGFIADIIKETLAARLSLNRTNEQNKYVYRLTTAIPYLLNNKINIADDVSLDIIVGNYEALLNNFRLELNTYKFKKALKEYANLIEKQYRITTEKLSDRLTKKELKFVNDFDKMHSAISEIQSDVREGKTLKDRRTIDLLNALTDKDTSNHIRQKIFTVSKFFSKYITSQPAYSTTTVTDEKLHSVQMYNFASKTFRTYSEDNVKEAIDFYLPFAIEAKSRYTNWIWAIKGDDGIFNPIKDNEGNAILFKFDKDGNETNSEDYFYLNYKIDDSNPINLDFINNFQFHLNLGYKDSINSKDSKEYDGLLSVDREVQNLILYKMRDKSNFDNRRSIIPIPSGESGTGFALSTLKFNSHYNPFTDETYIPNRFSNNLSSMYKLVNRDLFDMYYTMKHFYELSDGIIKVKPQFSYDILPEDREGTTSDLEAQSKANDRVKLNITKYYAPAEVNYDIDDNGRILLIKDGKPTIRQVQDGNLSIFENNKHTFLYDYLVSKGFNILSPEYKTYEDLLDALENAPIDDKINVLHSFEIESIRTNYERYINSKLFANTKDKLNELGVNTDDIEKLAYHYNLDFIGTMSEYNNLVLGDYTAYKNRIDRNKRESNATRPGKDVKDAGNFTAITVADPRFIIYNIEELKKVFEDPELKRGYDRISSMLDGLSIITLKEFKDRMKAFGRYEAYKDTIDKLEDPEAIFSDKESALISEQALYINEERAVEQLKFFHIERTLNNNVYPKMITKATKNSTIVISPNGSYNPLSNVDDIKDEDVISLMGIIHKFMVDNGIDQLDFAETRKVNKKLSINLFNDGDKPTDYLKLNNLNKDLINAAKETRSRDTLFIQQDIKSHMVDEVNTMATQLAKLIIANIDDNNIYNIPKSVEGFEGKATGKELKKLYQDVVSDIVRDNLIDILREWGAIDLKGNIIYKDGNINVKPEILYNFLINNLEKDNYSDYLRDFLKLEPNTENELEPNIPIIGSISYDKFISVLTSVITNNIIKIKLDGAHAVITPDLGWQPMKFIKKDNQIVEDLKGVEDQIDKLNFTKAFKEQVKQDKRNGLTPTLKCKINSKGERIAQVILGSHWSKQFVINDKVDINTIDPELLKMIGFRIPVENPNSVVLLEVVGIMNIGSSQAIFPSELIKQTGWDFDIDTAYFYYKTGKVVKEDNQTVIKELTYNKFDDYLNKLLSNLKQPDIKETLNKLRELQTTIAEKNSNLFNIVFTDSEENKLIIDSNIDIQNKVNNVVDNILNKSIISNYQYNKEIKSVLNSIRKYISNKNIKDELKKYNKEIDINILKYKTQLDFIDIILNDNEFVISDNDKYLLGLFKTITNISLESTGVTDNNFNYILNVLSAKKETNNNKKEEIVDSINNYIIAAKTGELTFNEYIDIPYTRRIDKKLKQNLLVDLYISIMGNPNHRKDIGRPNEYKDAQNAIKYVDKKIGKSTNTINQIFPLDSNEITTRSLQVRNLKGIAVNIKNMADILNVINPNMTGNVINFVFKYDSNNIDNSDLTKEQVDKLEEVYGKSNITKTTKDGVDYYFVNNFKLASNKSNTHIRLDGSKITNGIAEYVSNILDAIKDDMGYLFDENTINLIEYITMMPHTHLLDGKANPHIYSFLSMGTPLVIEAIEEIRNGRGNLINILNNKNKGLQQNIIKTMQEYVASNDDTELITSIIKYINKVIANEYDGKEDIIREYKEKKSKLLADNNTSALILLEAEYKNKLPKKLIYGDKQLSISNNYSELKSYLSDILKKSEDSQIINLLTNVLLLEVPDNHSYSPTKDDLIYLIDTKSSGDISSNIKLKLIQLHNIKFIDKIGHITSKIARSGAAYSIDKKGVGPDLELNDVLNNSIFNTFVSESAIQDRLYKLKIDKDTTIEESVAEDMYYELISNTNLTDRYNLLVKWSSMYENGDTLLKTTDLFEVNGMSMIEAVYPNIFKGSDVNDSMYPMLASRYEYGHKFAINAFKPITIFQSNEFKLFTNYLMKDLGIFYNEDNLKSIRNWTLNYITNNHSFFKDSYRTADGKIVIEDRKRLLGIERDPELIAKIKLDGTTEDVKSFSKLSFIDKLEKLRNDKVVSKYFKDTRFKGANAFDLIEVVSNDRLAYQGIRFITLDYTQEDLAYSFDHAFYNENPYIRLMAIDAVKYTFRTTGLKFGLNLNKCFSSKLFENNEFNDSLDNLDSIKPGMEFLYNYDGYVYTLKDEYKLNTYGQFLKDIHDRTIEHNISIDSASRHIFSDEYSNVKSNFLATSKLNDAVPNIAENYKLKNKFLINSLTLNSLEINDRTDTNTNGNFKVVVVKRSTAKQLKSDVFKRKMRVGGSEVYFKFRKIKDVVINMNGVKEYYTVYGQIFTSPINEFDDSVLPNINTQSWNRYKDLIERLTYERPDIIKRLSERIYYSQNLIGDNFAKYIFNSEDNFHKAINILGLYNSKIDIKTIKELYNKFIEYIDKTNSVISNIKGDKVNINTFDKFLSVIYDNINNGEIELYDKQKVNYKENIPIYVNRLFKVLVNNDINSIDDRFNKIYNANNELHNNIKPLVSTISNTINKLKTNFENIDKNSTDFIEDNKDYINNIFDITNELVVLYEDLNSRLAHVASDKTNDLNKIRVHAKATLENNNLYWVNNVFIKYRAYIDYGRINITELKSNNESVFDNMFKEVFNLLKDPKFIEGYRNIITTEFDKLLYVVDKNVTSIKEQYVDDEINYFISDGNDNPKFDKDFMAIDNKLRVAKNNKEYDYLYYKPIFIDNRNLNGELLQVVKTDTTFTLKSISPDKLFKTLHGDIHTEFEIEHEYDESYSDNIVNTIKSIIDKSSEPVKVLLLSDTNQKYDILRDSVNNPSIANNIQVYDIFNKEDLLVETVKFLEDHSKSKNKNIVILADNVEFVENSKANFEAGKYTKNSEKILRVVSIINEHKLSNTKIVTVTDGSKTFNDIALYFKNETQVSITKGIDNMPLPSNTVVRKYSGSYKEDILDVSEDNVEVEVSDEIENDEYGEIYNNTIRDESIFTIVENILRVDNEFKYSELQNYNELSELSKNINDTHLLNALKSSELSYKGEALNYINEYVNLVLKNIWHNNRLLANVDFDNYFSTSNFIGLSKTLNESNILFNSISHIENIDYLSETGDDSDIKVEAINNIIREIKEKFIKVKEANYLNKQKQMKYINTIIVNTSRNPNFNTKYSKLIDKIKASRFDNLDEFSTDINEQELAKNIKFLLKNNEDINAIQLYLDSVFSCGIPIVETMMNYYFTAKYAQINNQNRQYDTLFNLWKEFTGNDFEKDSSREAKFKKLIDKNTGGLLAKYDYGTFWDEYNNVMEGADYKDKSATFNKFMEDHCNKTITISDEELARLDALNTSSVEKKQMYARQHNIMIFQNKAYKFIPNDNYISKQYNTLNDKEKTFLNGLGELLKNISETCFNDSYYYDGFLPIMGKEKEISKLHNILGWQPIKKSKTYMTINNESRYYQDIPMIKNVEKYQAITISETRSNYETDSDWEKSVLNNANLFYNTIAADIKSEIGVESFKSIEEIEKYNKLVKLKNKEYTKEIREYDPLLLLKTFISSANNYKFTKDFYNHYLLLLSTVGNSEFEIIKKHKNGDGIVNSIRSAMSTTKEFSKVPGTETNVFKQLKAFEGNLFSESNITNKAGQVGNVIKHWTSLTYMGLGMINGIKNISTGEALIVQEAVGKEYYSSSDLKKATGEYMAKIMKYIAQSNSEYTDDVTVGVMKAFSFIFEPGNERASIEANRESKTFLDYANRAVDLSYFINNKTEHFMQFQVILAMMESHRVVEGQIMSEFEYVGNNIEQLCKELMPSELYKDMKRFVTNYKKKSNKDINVSPSVLYSKYIQANSIKLGNDFINKYNKRIKQVEKDAAVKFKEYETLKNQFEIKDKRIVLKNDNINDSKLTKFLLKAKSLNNSMQGEYSKEYKKLIEQTVLGSLAMQFKKYMRPAWDRYYGKRFGRGSYVEALDGTKKGIYISLYDYLTIPISNIKTRKHEGDIESKMALTNILSEYGNMIVNYKFYYNSMTPEDRANIRKALAGIVELAILTLALVAVAPDDDDDDKLTENYLRAFIIYELAATQGEVAQFLPFAWYGTVNKTKNHIIAGESFVNNAVTTAYDLLRHPFLDEKEREIKSGIYKGYDPITRDIMSKTPILRQFFRVKTLPNQIGFTKMNNPLSQFMQLN